jgi:BirA family biotin operon repressor/biotin-[acetyl-CoA-carboxylase] ligase
LVCPTATVKLWKPDFRKKSGFLIMDKRTLRRALSNVPLGGLHYFEQTSSTNDMALAWAAAGAPDLALVYAEEQTAGRGRGSRSWFTPPNAALAFSLVLRPLPGEQQSIPLFSALGALAVSEVLAAQGLHPKIKWPNDVLLNRRKVCGVLAESIWTGDKVDSIVLGIGVNIKPESVPPADQLNFPATCLETEATLQDPQDINRAFDRLALLRQILQAIFKWRDLLETDIFINAWESHLAFCGEQVEIWREGQDVLLGQLDGLERDGSLRLCSPQGGVFTIQFGEVHLRPVV